LLIDKKPFYLTVEDVRYDMVSEVDFSHRLLNATVSICTVNKKVIFTSYHNNHLRALTAYLQDKVMETRHQGQPTAQPQTTPEYQLQQDTSGVSAFQYRATNPYTKVPLMMRRRVSRFYS
jgi:hypothetical protein